LNFPEKIQDSKIQKNFTIFGCETKRQVRFITLLPYKLPLGASIIKKITAEKKNEISQKN